MALTKAQMIGLVEGGTRRSDRREDIALWLNAAQREALRRYMFTQARRERDYSLLEGTSAVDLDARVLSVLEVRVIDGTSSYCVELLPKGRVVEVYPNVDALTTTKPWWCYREGQQLRFAPRANADYTVRVTAQEFLPDLGDDSDECSVPLLDEYLVAYATAELFRSVQLYQDAQYWEAQAEKRLLVAQHANENLLDGGTLRTMRGVGEVAAPFVPPHLDPFAGYTRRP